LLIIKRIVFKQGTLSVIRQRFFLYFIVERIDKKGKLHNA
jgi:hypothetical protein